MRPQQQVHDNRPLSALFAGLARVVSDRVIDSVRHQGRRRARTQELAQLDDRLLRDIGLTRPEIHAAVYGPLSSDRASPSASRDAKAAALVRELSDHLLHASTATEALHAWCAAHGLSAGPIAAVKQEPDRPRYADDDVLDELRPERHERIAHHCVRLVRGLVVLSEADNWFIPERLPPEVRSALETTNLPVGGAIARLRPSRRTYFVSFPELRTASEAGTAGCPFGLPPSMPVLEHKAVVLDQDRRPLSVVSERYCAALLSGSQAMSARHS